MRRLLLPILFFTVLLTIFFVNLVISSHVILTVCFAAFAVCYMLTLFFGILDLIARVAGDPNSDVFQKSILKVVEKSCFLLPMILFSLLILFFAIALSPNKIGSTLYFSLFFLLCLLFYFGELFLARNRFERHLKAIDEMQKETRRRNQIQSSSRIDLDSKKRLLLINPLNQSMFGSSDPRFRHHEPLAMAIIAALTPNDFHVELIDENVESLQYKDADLVAITGFTSSAYRAYEIASHYRRNGIPVVMGGIHASMMPDEASQYVDTVVIGEAEAIWGDVVVDFLQGNLKDRYHGVRADLSNMVRPKREVFSNPYPWVCVQTSRGCPMDCDFCSVTAFNGREYRVRPIEDVLNELEDISARDIAFIDDNLIGYSKNSVERAKNLCRGMIERNLKKRWVCQSAINFGADDELLSLAQQSGCRGVLIGFESDDPEELLSMNKRLNLRFQYKKVLKNLKKHRILVQGAFIYGTEQESRQSMWRKTRFICRNHIDAIQASVMTPLPGTRLFEKAREEGSLVHGNFPKDWERYHLFDITYQPKGLEEEEFMKHMKKCMDRVYSKWTMSKKLVETIAYTRRPLDGISAYVFNATVAQLWERSLSLMETRLSNEAR